MTKQASTRYSPEVSMTRGADGDGARGRPWCTTAATSIAARSPCAARQGDEKFGGWVAFTHSSGFNRKGSAIDGQCWRP